MKFTCIGANPVAKDLLLVVGNGLSLDLKSCVDLIPNSSNPLSVSIIPDHHFCDGSMANLDFNIYFPHLMEVISQFRSSTLSENDFGLIEDLLKADDSDLRFISSYIKRQDDEYLSKSGRHSPLWEDRIRKALSVSQLRLYIIYVFSYFDRIISDEHLENWRWTKWLTSNIHRVSQIISFNYDITVERAINKISVENYVTKHKDVNTRVNPLLIAKPHGSINHTISGFINTRHTPWNKAAENIIVNIAQGPVSVLSRKNLYQRREFSDIVLPTEAPGARRKMKQINCGYNRLARISKNIETCVIAGLSYSDADRPEINEIISLLPNAKIIVVDPAPSPDLLRYLSDLGRQYTIFLKDLPDL